MAPLWRLSEFPLRLPRLRPYVPNPDDPAIFWFNSERRDILREVVSRVVSSASADRARAEIALNDTALRESRRLATQKDDEARQSLGYWRGLLRRIGRMTDQELSSELESIVRRMTQDVAGNFDPRVYKLATGLVPQLMASVMQPSLLPKSLANNAALIDRLLSVEGDVERLQRLARIGTLVYVPTHSSNLDSVVLAQALEESRLPPVIYGAGKNLFSNPILSFFMHNLGAYRVDRRVTARLYKDVLKAYSCVMVERGYHSLFFPGGTRSRSGLIESHLKLGLMGSAVEAFARNQVRGRRRRVWFVPTTINYELVLEAETLIQDYLVAEGQSRYIIEDDEFSRVERWIAFLRNLFGQEGACIVRFGSPLDPFGNEVDAEGNSLRPDRGTLDPASYVSRHGQPLLDAQRDAAYTRDLGELLVQRFRSDTVLMATQVVAHVLFRRFVRETSGLDVFHRMRLRGEIDMTREELVREVGIARDRLRRCQVVLSPTVVTASPERIVDRALSVFLGYHSRNAAEAVDGKVVAQDPGLLLYYQNRLVPFAEEIADAVDRDAALEIGRLGVR